MAVTIVLDGNKRFHVITGTEIRYTGNNVLKYYWHKLRHRRSNGLTTVKYGRTFR
jgi:hypothetical protein